MSSSDNSTQTEEASRSSTGQDLNVADPVAATPVVLPTISTPSDDEAAEPTPTDANNTLNPSSVFGIPRPATTPASSNSVTPPAIPSPTPRPPPSTPSPASTIPTPVQIPLIGAQPATPTNAAAALQSVVHQIIAPFSPPPGGTRPTVTPTPTPTSTRTPAAAAVPGFANSSAARPTPTPLAAVAPPTPGTATKVIPAQNSTHVPSSTPTSTPRASRPSPSPAAARNHTSAATGNDDLTGSQAQSVRHGIVTGAGIAGGCVVLLITSVVLFLLWYYDKLPCCHNKRKRHQAARSRFNTHYPGQSSIDPIAPKLPWPGGNDSGFVGKSPLDFKLPWEDKPLTYRGMNQTAGRSPAVPPKSYADRAATVPGGRPMLQKQSSANTMAMGINRKPSTGQETIRSFDNTPAYNRQRGTRNSPPRTYGQYHDIRPATAQPQAQAVGGPFDNWQGPRTAYVNRPDARPVIPLHQIREQNPFKDNSPPRRHPPIADRPAPPRPSPQTQHQHHQQQQQSSAGKRPGMRPRSQSESVLYSDYDGAVGRIPVGVSGNLSTDKQPSAASAAAPGAGSQARPTLYLHNRSAASASQLGGNNHPRHARQQTANAAAASGSATSTGAGAGSGAGAVPGAANARNKQVGFDLPPQPAPTGPLPPPPRGYTPQPAQRAEADSRKPLAITTTTSSTTASAIATAAAGGTGGGAGSGTPAQPTSAGTLQQQPVKANFSRPRRDPLATTSPTSASASTSAGGGKSPTDASAAATSTATAGQPGKSVHFG